MKKYILGIDAAWTNKEPSGVALLEYSDHLKPKLIQAGRSYEEFCLSDIDWTNNVTGTSPEFKNIIDFCLSQNWDVDVIALDIPLSPITIEGRREADNLISKRYGKVGASTHSPTLDRPGYVSTSIYDQLIDLGFTWAKEYTTAPAFIEVYPHVAIIEIFKYSYRFPYKVQKKNKYWPNLTPQERNVKIINNLNELRSKLSSFILNVADFISELNIEEKYSIKFLKGYEDVLDGLVSALVGYFFMNNKAVSVGDEYSAIWIPNVE